MAGVLLLVMGACNRGDASAPPDSSLPVLERCGQVPAEAQAAEGIEVIHAFDGSDGASPWGTPLAWQDKLFGRAWAGGPKGGGVLFSLDPATSAYQVLTALEPGPEVRTGSGPRFDHPGSYQNRLTFNVAEGGTGDGGTTIFVDPANRQGQVIHRFAGGPDDGAHPSGGIETTVEGMWITTPAGGSHDQGALVRLDPETWATEVAHSFSGPDGAEPRGRAIRSGDRALFGMTSWGGRDDAGVIYTFDPVTREFRVLHEFGGGAEDGARPHHGKLTGGSTDQRLWGLTEAGGAQDRGTLFSIAPDGSDLRVHHSFGAGPDDATGPQGSLVRAGQHLYGLAATGGKHDLGALFRVDQDGGGYEVIASFGGSETGAFPRDDIAAVVVPDRPAALYGMTATGGPNDPDCRQGFGTVFKVLVDEQPRLSTPSGTAPSPS